MTDFDELHPREPGGRFTDKHQSDPELSLAVVEDLTTREVGAYFVNRTEDPTDRAAVDPYVNSGDVGPGLQAFGNYVDVFVASIDEGHLSRGVAGQRRADAARAWASDADAAAQTASPEVAEFRDGVQRGIVALYYEKVPYEGPLEELTGAPLAEAARRALVVATTKRASRPEREFWRRSLQNASAGEHRGMLVAAAALSGTDQWWGFRARPRAVMTGDF